MKLHLDRLTSRTLLPAAYRRWPLLGGVAAGLWVLVLMYLGRMLFSIIRGDTKTTLFSLLWSTICLLLWRLLHAWARRQPLE